MIFTSVLCSFITFVMAILHLLLVFGVPIGEYVLGGKEKIIPQNKRWFNILFFIIFSLIGLLYLNVYRPIFVFSLPQYITKITMGVYTVFLAYAIIGNIFFTKSKKEQYVMIPSSVFGFITSLLTLIQL